MRAIYEDEWLEIFAAKVKRALIEQRLTQEDLSRMSGISDAAISTYLLRQNTPGVRAILNIAHALDIPVEELIDYGADIF